MVVHAENSKAHHSGGDADSVDFLDEGLHRKVGDLGESKDASDKTQMDSHSDPETLATASVSLSSGTCNASMADEESSVDKHILKSDHKRQEEQGFHDPEPLLTENPRRFVLFPIQDNEVSG
mmetsp:Transcript_24063/g.56141  ORF Transcript_24063/g.56141 Transcript_24063/m.56141 type:complete len:122 (-) Transcript_24063:295-660(-)